MMEKDVEPTVSRQGIAYPRDVTFWRIDIDDTIVFSIILWLLLKKKALFYS